MKTIIVKIIIAISFGIMVGQYKAKNEPINRYYHYSYYDKIKMEISEEMYIDGRNSKYYKEQYSNEQFFNKSLFLSWMLIISAGATILLLLPELIKFNSKD